MSKRDIIDPGGQKGPSIALLTVWPSHVPVPSDSGLYGTIEEARNTNNFSKKKNGPITTLSTFLQLKKEMKGPAAIAMIALPQLSIEIMLCYHFGLKLTCMCHTHSQALGSDIFVSTITFHFF